MKYIYFLIVAFVFLGCKDSATQLIDGVWDASSNGDEINASYRIVFNEKYQTFCGT